MADFTPKKLVAEKGHAKAGEGKPSVSQDEHMSPPRVYLEHHHLAKLGLKEMPKVGSKIHISGLAHVGATSEHDSADEPGERKGDKKRRSMTLHLHKMEMGTNGPGKEVNQEAETAKGAKAAMDKALKRGAGGKNSEHEEGEEDDQEMTPRGGGD
jgi:hypothetical protein